MLQEGRCETVTTITRPVQLLKLDNGKAARLLLKYKELQKSSKNYKSTKNAKVQGKLTLITPLPIFPFLTPLFLAARNLLLYCRLTDRKRQLAEKCPQNTADNYVPVVVHEQQHNKVRQAPLHGE
jgi:hypothetical protein